MKIIQQLITFANWMFEHLVTFAAQAFEFPVVRVTLYICIGAVSKSFATTFISSIPMDELTRKVFGWLQFLALMGFCAEVTRYVLEDELGTVISKLRECLEKLLEYLKYLFRPD